MTVAAVPDGSEPDLGHELYLSKAALLYADRVTLASPKAVLLGSLRDYRLSDPRERLEATAEMLGAFPDGDELARTYNELKRRKHRSREELALLGQIESLLSQSGEDMATALGETLDASGMEQLALAVDAGILDVDPLGSDRQPSPDELLEGSLERLAEILVDAVSPGTASIPLFDGGVGDLLSAMIRDGRIIDADRYSTGEVGAAGQLIARIDTFPDAPMDEILDLRERLQSPLVGFRSAMAEAAYELDSAAWEAGFASEVSALHRRTVAPALREIEEAIEELGARKTLRRVARSRSGTRTAQLGLAAALASSVADLPIELLEALSVPAIGTFGEELRRRKELRSKASGNRFYFLFEGNRLLASAHR